MSDLHFLEQKLIAGGVSFPYHQSSPVTIPVPAIIIRLQKKCASGPTGDVQLLAFVPRSVDPAFVIVYLVSMTYLNGTKPNPTK